MTETIQAKVFRVGADVFGLPGQLDQRERFMRFFEEAVELVRAGGLGRNEISDIIDYEFSRRTGSISQEFGGAGVTLFAAAQSCGLDLLALVEREIDRIAANKEKCQAKHAAKPVSVVSTRATS